MSSVEVLEYIDKKFDEFKTSIVEEVSNELKKEVKSIMKLHLDSIEKLESTVSMLQQHVEILKQQTKINLNNNEELEQYGRRLCLRLDGMPCEEKETSDLVYEKVKNIIKNYEIDIPDLVIDRAHRIGHKFVDESSGNQVQSVILRFTTFRHRTQLYRYRKKSEKDNGIRVRLDLKIQV